MLDATTEALRALRGQRVRVSFLDGGTDTGVLEGVTAERIFLVGTPGLDLFYVTDVSPAPLVCSVCGRETARLFDDMCADDYRKDAATKPPVREACELCLEEGRTTPGIRNPGTDEFLCMQHHAERGNNPRLTVGNSAVLADCATEDSSSDKHVWTQVRGARFRCIRCQNAEKYDPELLKSLRDELT